MAEQRKAGKPRRWAKALAAVLLGNAAYFGLSPHLPDVLQHKPFQIDQGLAVDFLICAGAYLLFALLGRFFRPK
jgi:hypothetical protein